MKQDVLYRTNKHEDEKDFDQDTCDKMLGFWAI